MKLIITSFALLTLLLVSVPATSFAAIGTNGVCDPGNVPGSGASSSTFCSDQTSDNPIAGPNGLINEITVTLSIVAGIAAIIIIIIGALQYVLSGGDPAKTNKAKDTILYALIGLVVIVLAQAIIRYVLSKF